MTPTSSTHAFDFESFFAELSGEKAGEDAGDGAADLGRCIHDAGALVRIQAEGRVQPNQRPAVKALGGEHRQEQRLLDVPDRDLGVEVVSVKFSVHDLTSRNLHRDDRKTAPVTRL